VPEEGRPRRGSRQRPAARTSWDALATWYNGWVGEGGSEYHRQIAVPAVLRLLEPQPNERILDVGAGQGVLAPWVSRAGAEYVGIDASPRLIDLARKQHAGRGQFYVADARQVDARPEVAGRPFDAAVFLLSLQDMDPLEVVLASVARVLSPAGRIVLLLTHPAFRVPRQSGWGYDEGRKLVYRRVDRYLTPLPVPMKPYPGKQGVTRSFHRPISLYVNSLAELGFLIDHLDEIPAHKLAGPAAGQKAENLARREIPLFLAMRARRNQLLTHLAD
jgi:ubiquinone/menaquinone biosynthesis C-methylase UbiE